MSKHTKGPWTAHIQRSKNQDDLGWIIEHANGRIGWASLAYADTNKEASQDDPAREANARLIAAAPDLLALVKELREYVFVMKGAGHEWPIRLDAAIAKADTA
jgi:hypothetical protein